MYRSCQLIAFCAAGLLTFAGEAQNTARSSGNPTPRILTFQGRLLTHDGSPIQPTSVGSVRLLFALYDAPAGGTAKWTSGPIDIAVRPDGFVTVRLGSEGRPLDPDLRFDSAMYLGMKVESPGIDWTATPEMLPRLSVTAGLFAHNANDATFVQGEDVVSTLRSHERDIDGVRRRIDGLGSTFVDEGQKGAITSEMIVPGAIDGSHVRQDTNLHVAGLQTSGNVQVGDPSTKADLDVHGRILRRGRDSAYSGVVDHEGIIEAPWGTTDDWVCFVSPHQIGTREIDIDAEQDNAVINVTCRAVPSSTTTWKVTVGAAYHFGSTTFGNGDAIQGVPGKANYLLLPR